MKTVNNLIEELQQLVQQDPSLGNAVVLINEWQRCAHEIKDITVVPDVRSADPNEPDDTQPAVFIRSTFWDNW